MPFTIVCPNCNAQLTAKNETLIGKTLPCPKCKHTFVIEKPASDNKPLSLGDSSPPLAGESAAHKGLSRGTVLGIAGGAAALILLFLIVLVVMLISGGNDSPRVADSSNTENATSGAATESNSASGSAPAAPAATDDGSNAEPGKPEGPPPAPINDKGAPPQQEVASYSAATDMSESAEVSLIATQLIEEPAWAMDAEKIKPDAAQSIDLPSDDSEFCHVCCLLSEQGCFQNRSVYGLRILSVEVP